MFIWGQCLDAECVDVLLHQVVERPVNHLMPLQGRFAFEVARYDSDRIVTAAAFGALVSGMMVAVIAHGERMRLERFAQAALDHDDPVHELG